VAGIFLDGVRATADSAVDTCQRLLRLFADDRAAIERQAGAPVRRCARTAHCGNAPSSSLPAIVERTGLSYPAAAGAVELLTTHGIAGEITGKPRDRLFAYRRYLDILGENAGE